MKIFPFLAAFTLTATASAADIRVIDGDTLELSGEVHRIHGIDAPEHGQKCGLSNGKSWPCGKAATAAMVELVSGRSVECETSETDQYGRSISTCYADGEDIGALMVERGHAWAFVRFSNNYVGEEKQARRQGLGIWQGKTTPAWEYRTQQWNNAAAKVPAEAPDGCPIKGNISQNGKIYHTPWSPYYTRTKINTSKGERWFCDEAEAVSAGWRAPLWGG